MISFGVEPFEPGNMLYIGMQEELVASVINDFVDNVSRYWGGKCYSEDIVTMLTENDIEYVLLPQYLKDKLDTIECLD